MIARVEQMVTEDRRLTVEQIAANASISVGSVDAILHDDLKMWKVSVRWVPRMVTDEFKASRIAMCQAVLSRDKGTCTKRFLAVSNTEGHSSWSHIFKSFRSCNSDFPVVTTNPQRSVCCGYAIVALAL
jgi:hypothetical protein